ncbi:MULTISPECIES: mechanosensitive ion channel family protein [Psychrilyobacter]|nr:MULTISPECIES: mechanosensitive ion channel family protein [Psychrilyobacter]MCS5422272.1 mechanosensitive ion channel family protein [Psychrilyobacter sp. S5]NDI77536.1 mechanosensitive ion channel family protein [Psychrilyobacter piezotolerans]
MNIPLKFSENMNILFKPIENILLSILLIVVFLIVRMIFYKGIERFGRKKFLSHERIKITERFVVFFVGIIIFSTLLLVWGVKLREFFLIIATTFTIIGTACFASWSNLSNISSGVILFFNYNIKLGDKVRVGSGDDQIEGVIHNMKLFYVEIITMENELVFYPNNTMLHQPVTILKN